MPKNLQFSLTDLQTPEGLERLLRQIVIPDAGEGGAELPNDSVLAARLAPYIRNQLQATGKAPLNLTALPGGSGGSITGDGNATHFLDGTLAFDTVKDTDLSVSDNTTNDASTTAHGFAPKGSGNAAQYLDGTLNWSTPAGSGGSVVPSTNGFRLTLATGYPLYAPKHATPSSTDTGTEVVTFAAAHGWVTGTICTVSATAGGLTAGTTYYLNIPSGTTASFHTTVANAESGASKVDLTASITAVVYVSGISRTTIYLTPFSGAMIALYDGAAWDTLSSAEVSLALGTLTANSNYTVFAYDNSGTLTLELGSAWAADTTVGALPPDCEYLNGVPVKTGTNTRRAVGVIRMNSTTTTISDMGGIISQVGGKQFVANMDNQYPTEGSVFDGTSSWTYNTETWRQFNGAAGNICAAVFARGGTQFHTSAIGCFQASGGGTALGSVSIGVDSTTAPPVRGSNFGFGGTGSAFWSIPAMVLDRLGPGYHTFAPLEITNAGSGTATWYGNALRWRSGLNVTHLG